MNVDCKENEMNAEAALAEAGWFIGDLSLGVIRAIKDHLKEDFNFGLEIIDDDASLIAIRITKLPDKKRSRRSQDEIKEAVLRLSNKNMTTLEIAKELNLQGSTVAKVLGAMMGVTVPEELSESPG